MELSLRQKKLLAAAARKIVKGDYDVVNQDNGKVFYDALQPVVRDAVMDAAPEIQKAEAGEIAACLIYGSAYFLNTLTADKDKGKKAAKPAKKSAAKKAPAKPAPKKTKAGTELDLFRKAAKPAKKGGKKNGK